MARTKNYLDVNSDDDYATRILSLVIKFTGSSRPIPSSVINAELYPALDPASFRRQYLRDRNLLQSLGVTIVEADSDGIDPMWCIDRDASFIEGAGISAEDARVLYILCYDMAFDPSFAYRDELRVALAKISQMYQSAAVPQGDHATPRDHKKLATLISCMSNRHAVQVTYIDAKGNESDRTLALLGSFGLRERTYFVASRVAKDGSLIPESLRTYRLDRIEKARETKPQISYQIPLDFSVHDFERLPFQIGDPLGIATLAVGENPGREVAHAMALQGNVVQNSRNWKVSYSSINALVSWCIGCGITPLAPADVVAAWHAKRAEAAAHDPFEPTLSTFESETVLQQKAGRPGRVGSALLIRQLMTVASSLTSEGEVLTAEQIAQALGISYDQARHLIMLMTLSGSESFTYLPVMFDDDYREVVLMQGAQLTAPRLRLTRAETIALRAALTELGVADDDPLSVTLSSSFESAEVSTEDIAQSLELPSSASDAEMLRVCSQAIARERGLSFRYQPVTGEAPRMRSVAPLHIRRSDDSWYLDAYDLDRKADRVFRIDRMSEVTETALSNPLPCKKHSEPERLVTVRFCDPFYLELFHWEGLQVLEQGQGESIVRLPYYGGSWLARHLAGCGDTVQVSDRELATKIVEVAQS